MVLTKQATTQTPLREAQRTLWPVLTCISRPDPERWSVSVCLWCLWAARGGDRIHLQPLGFSRVKKKDREGVDQGCSGGVGSVRSRTGLGWADPAPPERRAPLLASLQVGCRRKAKLHGARDQHQACPKLHRREQPSLWWLAFAAEWGEGRNGMDALTQVS